MLQPKHREPNNLKELLHNRNESTEQQYNSGHGVCEYMGATHSSQHTAPDGQHSSTCCCPTHEVWELPTPLIVANRSQQGDEVRELPAQPQQHPGTKLIFPLGSESLNRSLYNKQISTYSDDVAQVHYRNWTRHPLLKSESLAQKEYETQNGVALYTLKSLSNLKTNAAHN
ncbi:hypothetical protein F511_18035 [Dorcoceras hygrometricum]|uniref:Uncharacterized protein n=1 Tax=Dorcoceras hygrometricum TaxID=472368 RepID=A0A2Z7ABR1_9LAMI|nr:hypothetical protein F511_18035 [Dorcoceras hygrometricum]